MAADSTKSHPIEQQSPHVNVITMWLSRVMGIIYAGFRKEPTGMRTSCKIFHELINIEYSELLPLEIKKRANVALSSEPQYAENV